MRCLPCISLTFHENQFAAQISSHVTIENVSLTATNVMVMMTVEITVMKRDVVCDACFIHFYMHYVLLALLFVSS